MIIAKLLVDIAAMKCAHLWVQYSTRLKKVKGLDIYIPPLTGKP